MRDVILQHRHPLRQRDQALHGFVVQLAHSASVLPPASVSASQYNRAYRPGSARSRPFLEDALQVLDLPDPAAGVGNSLKVPPGPNRLAWRPRTCSSQDPAAGRNKPRPSEATLAVTSTINSANRVYWSMGTIHVAPGLSITRPQPARRRRIAEHVLICARRPPRRRAACPAMASAIPTWSRKSCPTWAGSGGR